MKKDSDDSENLIELKKSRAFFEIRLNPFDEEDQAILQTLKEIADGQYNKLDEFQGRIALLLKHDWERSKTEVNNKGKVAFIMFTILLCAFQSFLFKGKNKIIDIALDNGLSFCGEGTCEICDSVLKNQIATKSVNFIRQFLHFLQDSCVLNTILWILTIISAYYLVSIVLSIFSSKILKDYNTNRCVNIFFELFGVTTRVSHEEKECVFENKFCCIVLKIVVLAIILGLVCFLLNY